MLFAFRPCPLDRKKVMADLSESIVAKTMTYLKGFLAIKLPDPLVTGSRPTDMAGR